VIDQVEQYLAANQDRFVNMLHEFLRIPSISTDPTRADAVRQAGEWVRGVLAGAGLSPELIETARHPAVLADTGPVEGGGPTVLVYGHFDVQPVGDESLWTSPAFEPTVRDGILYARGSADDKGQVLTHLLAIEAWLRTAGHLPLRVKFLIEGEEEIGSPNLAPLIREHRDRLACDYVVISDTAKLDARTPAITYGTKGLIYKEVIVTGPVNDLHSGSFGGTIRNPGNALAAILTALRDKKERVCVKGFYEDVRPISAAEKRAMRSLPFSEQNYLKAVGVPALAGEAGYTTLERRWCRPTLDVNGLFGGFMGSGASTIIPAKVGAKVSMRIVPDQDPVKVSRAFDETVRKLAPPGVRVEVKTHSEAAAYMCPLDSPGIRAATAAVEAGFRTKPALIREGGTLPILPLFREVLGAESIMMGFCDPNCNAHGPNEFFAVQDFLCGIRSAAHFLHCLAEQPARPQAPNAQPAEFPKPRRATRAGRPAAIPAATPRRDKPARATAKSSRRPAAAKPKPTRARSPQPKPRRAGKRKR